MPAKFARRAQILGFTLFFASLAVFFVYHAWAVNEQDDWTHVDQFQR